MKCEEVIQVLEEFIDEELLGTPKMEVEQHLTSCDSCQKENHSLMRLRSLLKTLPQPKPPQFLEDAILTELEKIEEQNDSPIILYPFATKILAAAIVLFVASLSFYNIQTRKSPTATSVAKQMELQAIEESADFSAPKKSNNLSFNSTESLKKSGSRFHRKGSLEKRSGSIKEEEHSVKVGRRKGKHSPENLGKRTQPKSKFKKLKATKVSKTNPSKNGGLAGAGRARKNTPRPVVLKFKGKKQELVQILNESKIQIQKQHHNLFWVTATAQQKQIFTKKLKNQKKSGDTQKKEEEILDSLFLQKGNIFTIHLREGIQKEEKNTENTEEKSAEKTENTENTENTEKTKKPETKK